MSMDTLTVVSGPRIQPFLAIGAYGHRIGQHECLGDRARSQDWIWFVSVIGMLLLLRRGRMGCGMGHSHSHGNDVRANKKRESIDQYVTRDSARRIPSTARLSIQ